MSGSTGNESTVMREPVMCESGKRYVPVLSGNALRHRLVRSPGARFLIDQWGLAGTLSLEKLNWLFHGGNLTDKGGRESTALIANVYRLFPVLALVGTACPKQIIPGNTLVWRGMLMCRENAPRIARRLPEDWLNGDADYLRPASEFVDNYQYTRGDVRNSQVDLVKPGSDDGGDSNLMIFAGQQVIPGAAFLHGFDVRHAKTVEIGCLLLCLRLWAEAGGTIGGQASRGHGRLDMSILCEPEIDEAACIGEYLEHIEAVRDEAVACLDGLFMRDASPKKAGKGKAKKQASMLEDEADEPDAD